MIEVENLVVKFGGVVAIDGLNVSLRAPICGLIGPNGAGKTTLLNALNGFIRPASGKIRIGGRDVLACSPHQLMALGIRRMFQRAVVIETLNVWDNVRAVADNLPGEQGSRDAIARALAFVGLDHAPGRPAETLNLYERRALELARAVLGAPVLILMDEPAAGLNETETRRLRELMTSIPAFCNAHILLVDHDMSLVKGTCSELLVLNLGRQLAHGATADVLADPHVLHAYLGDAEEDA